MSDNRIRVRFAPSPTGPLHMGGVRTALFNYLFAKKNKGDFILRIEDTDQTRYVPGTEEYIIEALEWCGLKFDEKPGYPCGFGPYRQSERKDIYRTFAVKLINSGHAYYAFDTAEKLDAIRKQHEQEKKVFTYNAATRGNMKNSLSLPEEEIKELLEGDYVIRFKMPDEEDVEEEDMIRGKVVFNTRDLDDKVLFKSDGMPTYHLANVVDDHFMKVSHVIRGEEWLPSLPLHILLYRSFNWQSPKFAHLPLILKPTGKGKLSKRDGDKAGFPVFPLEWKDPETGEVSSGYREEGYFPEAFVNMLAFLGWNPGTEQEIFTLEELTEIFTLDRVNKSGARFDPEKTKWFNHQHLLRKPDNELAHLFWHELDNRGIDASDEYIKKVIALVKERVHFVHEMWDQASFFFIPPAEYDPKVVKKRWKGDVPVFMSTLASILEDVSPWRADEIKHTIAVEIESHGLGFGLVMNALRLALVGGGFGPDLMTIAEMLGKEETISRINTAVGKL